MQEQRKLSLEERLTPKLNQGEYLLVLVLALMLWIAGFVDLFTHTSRDRQVLGLYSWVYFAFLAAYSLGFIFWGGLIFPADSLTWFKKGIHFFQSRTVAGLIWFGGSAAILASMFLWERWLSYPLLEASTALLIILFSAVILMARPYPGKSIKPYRKALKVIIGLAIGTEATLQILSLGGILPVQKSEGMFIPYGRIYQSKEGHANDIMNKFGWYQPEFRLTTGTRRIVVLGDSFVQGLQVPKDELFSMNLDRRFAESQTDEPVEVLSLGMPGFGPGFYLDTILYPYILDPLQPDELVVFFHAANDFQAKTSSGGQLPYFIINSNGEVDVTEPDFGLRHDLWHVIIRGYEAVNPVETVATHSFLFRPLNKLVQRYSPNGTRFTPSGLNIDQASPEMPFGAASFVFNTQADPRADSAWMITEAQLNEFVTYASNEGITIRLVVIPYFPAEFYVTKPNEGWDPHMGDYDIFLPEQRLQEYAEQWDIPFLGLGEYLETNEYTLDEIKELYLNEGTGHFSTTGHAFVADTIFKCFYSSPQSCTESGP